MKVLVTDFSGVYEAEGFLPWLQEQEHPVIRLDFQELEGCHCYCDEGARQVIVDALKQGPLPRLRFIDSGDYHYMSQLLALEQTEPFHLLLVDHHPDNQDAAFGGLLSCGGWVKSLQQEQPLLRSVLSIGPEGCPSELPEGWLGQRRGERLYVSVDKDVLEGRWARTDWSQGTHTLGQLTGMLESVFTSGMEVVAVDICGEKSPEQGATGEDLRVNKETNIALYKLIVKHLNV